MFRITPANRDGEMYISFGKNEQYKHIENDPRNYACMFKFDLLLTIFYLMELCAETNKCLLN